AVGEGVGDGAKHASKARSGLGRCGRLRRCGGLGAHHLARAAFGFDFRTGRRTERVRAHREFFGQFAVAQNFDAVPAAIGQTRRAQRRFIHARAVVKLVQIADVHAEMARREPRVIEAALGNAADEGHLAAFKADADRAARTRRLAFAATTAGFAVAAGFTLAKALGTMFRTRTRFKIVQSHKNQAVAGAASGVLGVSTFLISRPRLL